jgi:hypothetical protein
MRRKAFDKVLTAGGMVVMIMLVAAGGLLLWGHNFAHNQVKTQLAQQQIFFPPAGSDALKSPEVGKYLNKYAGQQLVNGEQAKAYADHFIGVHLKGVADGQTYAQVSTKAQADPTNVALQGQVASLFKGETLRGQLLNAYAFDKVASIALVGAIVSFALAGLMALLSILGVAHLRRVSPEVEIFAANGKVGHKTPVTVG